MEWLFFLLPIAALSGWLLAKRHYQKTASQQGASFDPDYFKGLNFLLNEQPDKAIDVFIKLLEVNSETVETHLALANLFRRRGEADRAIRIHQNLIARPNLTTQQRDRTLVELGLDYMNAGVLDRAEQLFLDLHAKANTPAETYRQLVRIYQQEKKWPQAIEMAKQLEHRGEAGIAPIIAQFYCEMAEDQLKTAKKLAPRTIQKAHDHDKQCVRATLLEAAMLIDADQYRKAIKVLEQVERQDISYLPEALPLLFRCYQNTSNLKGLSDWLEKLLAKHPHLTSARLLLTEVIHMQHGSQAAHDYLYDQLNQYPSVEGIDTLMSLEATAPKPIIPLIKGITHTLVRKGHRYSCVNCGFSGKTMHWQCPSCNKWNSIKPIEIHLSSLESLLELSQ